MWQGRIAAFSEVIDAFLENEFPKGIRFIRWPGIQDSKTPKGPKPGIAFFE